MLVLLVLISRVNTIFKGMDKKCHRGGEADRNVFVILKTTLSLRQR